MKVFIILPARLESSRLPKKLIKKIGRLAIIEHMIISAKQIKEAIIIVSTDSKIIQGYADKHKVHSLYSDRKFLNGTERCFYTAKKFKAQKNDIVVNLQADEFNINMTPIKKLIDKVKNSKSKPIATLVYKSCDKAEYTNKNNVKVIVDKNSFAITFTRSNISSIKSYYLIHIGVYVFKFTALDYFMKLGSCHYEKDESLEQLRMIWNNVPIYCELVKNNKSIGINAPSDLKKARELYDN